MIAAARRAARLIGDAIVALPVLLVVTPLRWLPWSASRRLGRWYGYVAFVVYAPGRRAGQINLRHAFGPSLTRAQARRQILAVFGSMGQAIAEGLNFVSRHRGDMRDVNHLIEMEDAAVNERILADPRPKIFVTAHLGSWEVATAFAAGKAGGGALMRRGFDNALLDAALRNLHVPRHAQLIEKRGGSAPALAALRAGHNVGMLADETAGPRGAWVRFFGRDASTVKTPALLACLTGAQIVVAAAVRRPNAPLLYRACPIEPPADAGPDDVAAVTGQIAAVLEGWIREDPLQWRWIHWRWKHRPDGTEERYGAADLAAAFAASPHPVRDERVATR